MSFIVEPARKAIILAQYERTLAAYPRKKAQVDSFLSNLDETHALCLQFLYGNMHPNDILSFSPAEMDTYVQASLRIYDIIPYVKTIPQDIFFTYILSHRVNAEWLDFGRGWMMEQILPFVQEKSMLEAALSVNYWCYSYATYSPADNRTLGPLAVISSTLGRCGEESVLAVSALRSVGIPARQVYVPRWSHCDDNHAWVEAWVDGQWHYLGACEPEPVLDKGWFTAAASRAMLVHTKAWTCFPDPDRTTHTTPVYGMINATDHYAQTTVLTVHVTYCGKPAPKIPVEFQIDNYSELFPIHRQETDAEGFVRFETGFGDLCVCVFHNGRLTLKKVDLRKEQSLELALEHGLTLEELPPVMEMDLVPPAEGPQRSYQPVSAAHLQHMEQCEAHRMARRNNFHTDFPDKDFAPFVEMARCNFSQLEAFIDDCTFSREEKLSVLQTLRNKDFVDLRKEVLEDAILTARASRDQYPAEIWQEYILAPRILDEMLLPERHLIKSLFPDGFANPDAILTWMKQKLTLVPDYEVRNFYPSIYGCLTNGQIPGYCFGLAFTLLCRTFGFPARCNPVTKCCEWLELCGEKQIWHGAQEQPKKLVSLTLTTTSPKPVFYEEHFTLGCWDGSRFETLNFPNVAVEGQTTLQIPAGFYRLITTTRQIDGTASIQLVHFSALDNQVMALQLPADETARRLQNVDVLRVLPEGSIKETLEQENSPAQILIFAQPGAEPTEHLLQELLACQEQYNEANCDLHIFVENDAALQDPTLRLVLSQLHHIKSHVSWDPAALDVLHRAMQVGDLRLPFVLLQTAAKRAVYACANYNIRMAQTLLSIYHIIA